MPPASLNTNFDLPVQDMGVRRQREVVQTAAPLLAEVLRQVHPADPGGVLMAVLNSRSFLVGLGAHDHPLSHEQVLGHGLLQGMQKAYRDAKVSPIAGV
jgi:hypothetical protein